MEKWGVILNPVAGEGAAEKISDKIIGNIEKYKPGYILYRTEYPGHAAELSKQMLNEGCTHIIVAGGDGTVNEAAGPLVGKDVVFGVIPAGTGNDYMQITGFSESFSEDEWEQFFKSEHRAVDVGLCNGKFFFNGMGIGFDAEMTNAVTEDRIKTGRISKSKYNYFIVKTLLGYKEHLITFFNGGNEVKEQSFMTTCSIGRRYAGSFFLTPEAYADDGLLDVLKIKPLKLLERLSILTKVPSGSHLAHKKVECFKTDKIQLTFTENVPAHLDGELIKDDNFDISIIPGGLKLIYNPEGSHYLCEEVKLHA